jgi:hypothetical protein
MSYRLPSGCPGLILLLVNDAAQLDCMKNVPYRKLQDAVLTTNAYFFLVIDSKPYIYLV